MHVGIDFGTSNNALSICDESGAPKLIPLEAASTFLPSALFTSERSLIPRLVCDYLDPQYRATYLNDNKRAIAQGQKIIDEEGLHGDNLLCFGSKALSMYMQNPGEGYFIKSPKSFLGVIGLLDTQYQLFVNLCILFLGEIRKRAEAVLNTTITQVTIGRPVNFLGQSSEQSNAQAMRIIRQAALWIGWEEVDFRFEPVAAGYYFARQLNAPTNILVIDIGGGTSDCSLLHFDRTQTTPLAHQGSRIGGNDVDITLAVNQIMPQFGLGESTREGLPIPVDLFWKSMAVNDIPAQKEFYSAKTEREINALLRSMKKASKFSRFYDIWENRRSFELVLCAEKAKVLLTEQDRAQIDIADISEPVCIARADLWQASERLLTLIQGIVQQTLQGQVPPDLLYVTGGSARSVVVQEMLKSLLPGVPVHSGDHLSGVASGLAIQSAAQ